MEKPANYYSGWSQATFEAATDSLSRLKMGEADAIENCIQYLERDEYLYATGYIKEKMWRRLRHVALNETQKARLRHVALLYVCTRLSREFFVMCRLISLIGNNDNLRNELSKLQKSPEAIVRRRAILLLAYCESVQHGEAERRSMYSNFYKAQEEKRLMRRKLRKRPRL